MSNNMNPQTAKELEKLATFLEDRMRAEFKKVGTSPETQEEAVKELLGMFDTVAKYETMTQLHEAVIYWSNNEYGEIAGKSIEEVAKRIEDTSNQMKRLTLSFNLAKKKLTSQLLIQHYYQRLLDRIKFKNRGELEEIEGEVAADEEIQSRKKFENAIKLLRESEIGNEDFFKRGVAVASRKKTQRAKKLAGEIADELEAEAQAEKDAKKKKKKGTTAPKQTRKKPSLVDDVKSHAKKESKKSQTDAKSLYFRLMKMGYPEMAARRQSGYTG